MDNSAVDSAFRYRHRPIPTQFLVRASYELRNTQNLKDIVQAVFGPDQIFDQSTQLQSGGDSTNFCVTVVQRADHAKRSYEIKLVQVHGMHMFKATEIQQEAVSDSSASQEA